MVAERSRLPLILVVDDYQDAREMYATCLNACGFGVVEAETGDEAVAKAIELLPDAIVMDLSLPGMDGWTATRTLKQNARTRAIPVVALTGNARHGRSRGRARRRMRRVPDQAVPAGGHGRRRAPRPERTPLTAPTCPTRRPADPLDLQDPLDLLDPV